jgi:hypothetical protein
MISYMCTFCGVRWGALGVPSARSGAQAYLIRSPPLRRSVS